MPAVVCCCSVVTRLLCGDYSPLDQTQQQQYSSVGKCRPFCVPDCVCMCCVCVYHTEDTRRTLDELVVLLSLVASTLRVPTADAMVHGGCVLALQCRVPIVLCSLATVCSTKHRAFSYFFCVVCIIYACYGIRRALLCIVQTTVRVQYE